MANPDITVGAETLTVYSQPSSAQDTAVWRIEDPTVVPMYRPTLDLNARKNSTGSNVNMTLRARVPVVLVGDSGQTAPNTVVGQLSFTSLQNVNSEDVTQCLDMLIAGATALKTAIVTGKTAL